MTSHLIGAAIASCSEGHLLDACLEAASGFDEIIVFDLESDDDTSSVTAAHLAQLIQHPVVPYVELIRGRQLQQATTEWVLFLDPDEILPSGWLVEARQMVSEAGSDVAGFWIEYRDVAFGRRLDHARRGASKVALVRRERAYARPAGEVRPHDMLRLDGTVEQLAGRLPAIEHYGYRTVGETIEKICRYSTSGGVGNDISDSALRPFTCIKMLWGSVIMARAWRDGSPGVAVASMSSIGDYLGLLQRWDDAGRPETKMHRRDLLVLELVRTLHAAQWRVRRAISSKSKLPWNRRSVRTR